MNEKLFQFIWEYALFDTSGLCLLDGRMITILRPGMRNRDAGPDFIGARIRIGNTIWVGNVELHLKESDWTRHGHNGNRQYQNIILHVVLDADRAHPQGNFPVLNLSGKINRQLLEQYHKLMNQQTGIPCTSFERNIPDLTWIQWTDRLLHERWEQKTGILKHNLQQSNNDWNQLFYLQLARYFGAAVNTQAFLQLASSTPFSILARHRHNLPHLEAILFGQAGLLPAQADEPYTIELRVHYAFFKQKYGLQGMQGHEWKFLRMRPAHFPTIRIAQFAMLIHRSSHLFDLLIHNPDLTVAQARSRLQVNVSTYWKHHYVFGKESVCKEKILGRQMAHNLLINAIIPVRILYDRYTGNTERTEALSAMLRTLPAEANHITDQWLQYGFKIKDAYSSQALIQLYEQYCCRKQCLRCAIGLSILK